MNKLSNFSNVYFRVVGRDIPLEEIEKKLSLLEKLGAYNICCVKEFPMSVGWNTIWVDGPLWTKDWEDKVAKIGYSCNYVMDIRFIRAPIMWLSSDRARDFLGHGYMSVKVAKTVAAIGGGRLHKSSGMDKLLAGDITIGSKRVISAFGFFGFLLLPTPIVVENCGVFSGNWGFLSL